MNSVPFPAPLYHNYQYHQTTTSNPLPPLMMDLSRKRSINQHNKASQLLDKNLGGTSTCCVSSNFLQSPVPKHNYLNIPPRYRSGQLSLDAKTKNSGGDHDQGDSGALETVLKLYTAIKNQNIHELSDIIDDECQCVCNFFSSFQPLQGKKVHNYTYTCNFNLH